jgi:hypothetical protein
MMGVFTKPIHINGVNYISGDHKTLINATKHSDKKFLNGRAKTICKP